MNFLKRLKLALGIAQPANARGHLVKQQGVPLHSRPALRIRPFPAGAFTIICYCLMPNHFHFLIRQNTDIGIDLLIQKVCTSYAAYFHNKYNRVGHVFQGAFKSKLVENDSYFKYLSAYIHNNPTDPLSYDYSSFKDYLGLRKGQICDKSFLLGLFNNNSGDYKKFVLEFSQQDQESIKDILFEE